MAARSRGELIAIAVAIVAVGGLTTWKACSAPEPERGPGQPISAWVDGDGALVLADTVPTRAAPDYRFLRLDPVTGQERSRRIAFLWDEPFEHRHPRAGCGRPGPEGAELFVRTPDDARLLVHGDRLSAVDAAGATRWTVELGGACQLAHAVDGVLAVATADSRRRALGIDLVTGAVRWRRTF